MRSFNSKKTFFFWLLLLPKDKNGLVFLRGVMYPIHPRCRTSAASSAAGFVRTQETAATFPRNNLKQTLSTNGPKTEATDNLWGFWKTSKALPQHHILHQPSHKAKLFKLVLSIVNSLFFCSGQKQSPQPTVGTQVTGNVLQDPQPSHRCFLGTKPLVVFCGLFSWMPCKAIKESN